MKRIDELGITTWPWRYIGYHNHKNGEYIHLGEVKFADGRKLCYDISQPNAHIVSAAPELYEALREAVSDKCVGCCRRVDDENGNCASLCMVGSWRKALAKAAGEEVCNG